ncbi:MAG: uroporphyrinogen-III synthase [Candidatus Thioglobus sp.]|nr:uroporphyrinogen-III synthase [Candidatus Thioglobus sp.]
MNILLTRPLAQVKSLQKLVSGGGFQALIFPTLEVEKLAASPKKNHYQVLIFISVNAVECGLEVLKSLQQKPYKIFAVGAITAKKLADYGFEVNGFPQPKASSEALLSMPEVVKLRQQNILIFRGEGGRETLKNSLSQHNSVEYIEVYRRVICTVKDTHRAALSQFLQNQKGVISITSIQNLSNLLLLIAEINPAATELIKAYPLVILSERIENYAKSIGFKIIQIAPETSDLGLLEAIKLISKA